MRHNNGRLKKNPKIHTNVLRPSTADNVMLAQAVEERFLSLCKMYLRERGVELMFPPDLDSDVLRWRTMRVRHRKGDLRNTDDEVKSTRRIAQWTVDIKSRLVGQKAEKIDWGEGE